MRRSRGERCSGLNAAARDTRCQYFERRARAFGSAFRPSIRQHRGVHRARRRAGNRRDAKPRLFEKAVQYAPSECPVGTATLKGKIDQYRVLIHCMGSVAATMPCVGSLALSALQRQLCRRVIGAKGDDPAGFDAQWRKSGRDVEEIGGFRRVGHAARSGHMCNLKADARIDHFHNSVTTEVRQLRSAQRTCWSLKVLQYLIHSLSCDRAAMRAAGVCGRSVL